MCKIGTYTKQLKYYLALKKQLDKVQVLSLVDNFLSIDEMTSLLDGIQGRFQISIP